MRRFFLFILVVWASIQAEELSPPTEGSFSEWKDKPLDLIALFLPANPVILQAGGNDVLSFVERWPASRIHCIDPNLLGSASPSQKAECVVLDQWCRDHRLPHVDFVSLDLRGEELEVLKSSPEILKNASCVVVHTYFSPFRIGIEQYRNMKRFLENAGFQFLTNWYGEKLAMDVIFIKEAYFFNENTREFLKTHKIDHRYQRHFEPYFKVYYDIDDSYDSIKHILKQGTPYEGHIGKIIEQLTRTGSIALDIGAHIGVHTITMSRKTGPEGAVLAFEPNRRLYMELLQTLKLNHCDNVLSISKALSDHPQTVLLDQIRIFPESDEKMVGDLVEAVTLDSYNLENVSIIKMDVENYEYFVLKGAEQTLLKNRPIIIFECWIGRDYHKSDPKEKANFDRVISLLESYGYEIYVIYCNDFIAFPVESTGHLEGYKNQFIKLDLNNFNIGLN